MVVALVVKGFGGWIMRRRRIAITACLLLFIFVPRVHAQSIWQSEQGTWSNPDNWLGGVPNGADSAALFASDRPSGDATVEVDIPVTLGELRIENPNDIQLRFNFATITFSASDRRPLLHASGNSNLSIEPEVVLAGDLDVVTATADSTITLAGRRGRFFGDGDIIKSGPGTLVLAGRRATSSNRYVVQDGVLEVNAPLVLPTDVTHEVIDATLRVLFSASFPMVVSNGTVQVADSDISLGGSITFSGGSSLVSYNGPGNAGSWVDSVIALDSADLRISARDSDDLEIRGEVSGVGQLHFDGASGIGDVGLENSVSHDGGVVVSAGNVQFSGDNAYTGETHVMGGSLWIWHENGLGSTEQGTVIDGGSLTLGADSQESIIVRSGELRISGPVEEYTGSFELHGGSLFNTAVISSPVVVDNAQRQTHISGGNGRILGAISGRGDIVLAGELAIVGPIEIDGEVYSQSSEVSIASSNSSISYNNLARRSYLAIQRSPAIRFVGRKILISVDTHSPWIPGRFFGAVTLKMRKSSMAA